MPDASRQADLETFIRQSLLGVELVDTQFHLFSSISVSSGRVANPRVLAANDILLTKHSTFFTELLGSRTRTCDSDSTLVDIGGIDNVPQETRMDDYGYTSDSDLDDDDDDRLTSGTGNGNPQPATTHRTQPQVSHYNESETELVNGLNEGLFEAAEFVSDVLRLDLEPETNVQHESLSSSVVTSTRLGAIRSRHILVKDTAFQTWYTLLNYLYTGKVAFFPLKSAGMQSRTSSTSHTDEPRCSPKSMYRLACKIGLDDLRDEAIAAIRGGLTEHNILTELAHSLVASHPSLLEMELDVLYAHIASPPVLTGLPDFARRIANKEFRHGASMIIGIHSRLLQQPHPIPTPSPSPPSPSPSSEETPSKAEPLAEDADAQPVQGDTFGPQLPLDFTPGRPATPEALVEEISPDFWAFMQPAPAATSGGFGGWGLAVPVPAEQNLAPAVKRGPGGGKKKGKK